MTKSLTLVVLLFTATICWSQPSFQESCTDATLDSSSTLPINDSMVNGGDADLTMPAGCQLGATAFSDIVTCFAPANSCTVTLTCSTVGGSNLRASIVEGPCSSAPAACSAGGSDVGPPTSSSTTGMLMAGQSYCFVCQNTVGNADFDASITTTGDCGSLPVDLLSFDVVEGDGAP